MKKVLLGAAAAISMVAGGLAPITASAQHRRDRNWRDYRHDRNWRDYRHDRHDRAQWRYFGGHYGYNGYNGRWRTGQRFPFYNHHGYYINDWRARGLPPPWRGYRYYRDDNGDIVMAAIASGVIGMIVGSALSDDHHYRRW